MIPDDAPEVDLNQDGKPDVSEDFARFVLKLAAGALALVAVCVTVLLALDVVSWSEISTALASLVSLAVGAGGGAAMRK